MKDGQVSNKDAVVSQSNGPAPPRIRDEVSLFVREIDSLATSHPRVGFAITAEERDANDRLFRYAEKYGDVVDKDDQGASYVFAPPYGAQAARLGKEVANAASASILVPRVFVLALVGQFDAFVGRLLRSLFLLRPELLATSDRTLTLSEVLELGTLERATEHLLDKEIESVLRKSHTDQFTWMESRFNVKLRNNLASWPRFIELTERRNLFAHANGIVSEQYIRTCSKNGADLSDDCTKGSTLRVTPEYFKSAYECIFEVGVKLSQVLWRKVRPDQVGDADSSLMDVSLNLISAQEYGLACELLDFACDVLKKYATDHNRRIFVVNRAQVYKWVGNEEKCGQILDDEDWSACGLDFKLAVDVLRDDHSSAAKTMRAIGASGAPRETDYHDWPLFKEFRKSDEFAKSYEAVFQKPFVHIEKAMREDEKERLQAALDHLKSVFQEGFAPEGADENADE